ncbi:hypothetical protein MKZ17_07905 [Solibacillus sp. FSL R7-0682]|uniref:hypothetical protein n=1 Tax=Solibacillus sp. FSL R7-0682 TaxID=2921690 RepID=UPI0030FA5589
MWITPKLNWVATDYYNFEDLNRVENNTAVVAELVDFFVSLPPFVFVTGRNMQHIEFADSLIRIENTQNALRQRFMPKGWMTNKLDWAPNDRFTFNDARRLEVNANLLYRHYKGNSELIPRCGAVICGEGMI